MSRPDVPRGLCAILDGERVGVAQMPAVAREMANAGARWIQLRWKGATGRELWQAATAIRQALSGKGVIFLVNDRPDVAALAGADGVHLGQDDLPPSAARKLLGDNAIIGLSTHTLDEVQSAALEPVDYIGFGPIFATSSKRNASPEVSVEGLREATEQSGVPVVAIGGIDRDTAAECIAAGAHAVAVIGALYPASGHAGVGRRVAAVLATCTGGAP